MDYMTIIMLVVMLVVFYFMLIRPENKRKKEEAKMRSELAVGDEITTIGGVKGTICAVKETTVVIETGADRVRIEFTKDAIGSKAAAAAAESK
jgi:preprotein translocase subunit YajC